MVALLLAAWVLAVQCLSVPTVRAQTRCDFTLGFGALREQLPDIVGQCLENERFNPANSNAEQRTTGGLLVWRKTDNWTAYSDGSTTAGTRGAPSPRAARHADRAGSQ